MYLLRQLLVVALVAVLGVGATLPALGAYRCPTMGRRFVDGCCRPSTRQAAALSEDESADGPASADHRDSLGPRCCDPLPAPALEARAGAGRVDAGEGASYGPVCALLPPPSASLGSGAASWRHHAAQPRGRPPGELLALLGSVLRV